MKSSSSKRKISHMLILLICLVAVCLPIQHAASVHDPFCNKHCEAQLGSLAIAAHAQENVNHEETTSFAQMEPHTAEVNFLHPFKRDDFIPRKTDKIEVTSDLYVVPGGQTIGVKLKSAGIMVVGFHQVAQSDHQHVSPGEDAKISIGDRITHINGEEVQSISQVSRVIAKYGESQNPIKLTLLRNHEQVHITYKPVYDLHEKTYRLGLYIRDSATGVGTLTFHAPDQGVYGALGHVISDMDTQLPIQVGRGEIVHSQVTAISKSQQGVPGEKRAQLSKDSEVLGDIEKNTQFGIFGKMSKTPEHGYANERIPVATRQEVKQGHASIFTVIDGQKVEKFDIEIVHTSKQSSPATKGMVIKITDPRLIEKTGGIIQGMSGSPIVQNGKLVGAVTHVLVNDPKSGYGCYIEWMLQDAGIQLTSHKEPKAS